MPVKAGRAGGGYAYFFPCFIFFSSTAILSGLAPFPAFDKSLVLFTRPVYTRQSHDIEALDGTGLPHAYPTAV